MDIEAHRICLFLVFHKRIQASLDRTRLAWNNHKMRTERNRTPLAMYQLSREVAINRGYWTGDPGDPAGAVDDLYGMDDSAPAPPAAELRDDTSAPREEPEQGNEDAQRGAGIMLNSDDELTDAEAQLGGFDFDRDDGNWGMEVYIEAVTLYYSLFHHS